MASGNHLDNDKVYQILVLLKTTTLIHRDIGARVGVDCTSVRKVNKKWNIRHYITRRTWTIGDDPTLIDGRDCI